MTAVHVVRAGSLVATDADVLGISRRPNAVDELAPRVIEQGLSNPVSAGNHVWLTAHEHFVQGGPNILTSETDPFRFENAVACSDDLANLVYTLTASFNGSAATTAALHAGDQVELDVPDGAAPGHYVIHNLRSFDYIEPTSEIACWMTGAPSQ